MKTALVLGAGGFIGSHMVKRLKSEGYWVRGVDMKYPEFSKTEADEFLIFDLRDEWNVKSVFSSVAPFNFHKEPYSEIMHFDEVYQLAADMGGAGYIFTGEHDADVMNNSALINLHCASWAKETNVGKIFYSSSACMYPKDFQRSLGYVQNVLERDGYSLKESDAYPADPDSEYGWEKLFSERLYLAYARNHRLNVRIARFHNIYGPEGTYKGGREKAPAAMCRKAIEATGDFIDVWGAGDQTRSFLYIDDCIDAVRLLMESEHREPINIGSEEMVTINLLAAKAIVLSGKKLVVNNVKGPVGVHGRNSDNTAIRNVLGWEPKYSLDEGLSNTFWWIREQYLGPATSEMKFGYKFL